MVFSGTAPCIERGCTNHNGAQCSYVDRRMRHCRTAWCPEHQVVVRGLPYCRRHAGIMRALDGDADGGIMPDVTSRAASLCEWMANDLDGGIRAILTLAASMRNGWTLSTSPLTMVMRGTPRVASWSRNWMLSDATGPKTRVIVAVHESRDSEVEVWVDAQEVARFVPPWIGSRRTTAAAADVYSDSERREYLRSTLLQSIASATASRESFAQVGQAIERLADTEERFRESEERSRAVLDNVADGILTLAPDGMIESMNPSACRILGCSQDEFIDMPLSSILVGADGGNGSGPTSLAVDAEALERWADEDEPQEVTARRQDGTTFPVDFSISLMSLGSRRLFIATFRDISERKSHTEAIQYQALHDPLTSLPNRTLFADRLQQALLAGERSGTQFGILLIDLDRFKEVNDTLGHQDGDQMLQEVAARLRSTLRESDTVARLGGDEFAILPAGESDPGALVATATKVLAALRAPLTLRGHAIDVDASIGIAIYPTDGHEANILLRRADVAMYIAKRAKSGHALYSASQDQHSETSLTLVAELRAGIAAEQLVLNYQPKIDLVTGLIAGAEALVRWEHPRHGLLMPDRFVPVAEESGLIRPLTTWALNRALRQVRLWADAGLDIGVAVNLSPRNLMEPDFCDMVAALVGAWELAPDRLTLEIIESTAMAPGSLEVVARLRKLGVGIAIDDFGTGYSSLAMLKSLPVNEIKIDQSFVRDLQSNPDDAAIVRSTIDLGHHLGLKVVAEGVSDAYSRWMLETHGCDIAQGNFISPALSGEELTRWADQRRLWRAG